jgi:hypothetical protein
MKQIVIAFKIFKIVDGNIVPILIEPLSTYHDAVRWIENNGNDSEEYLIFESFKRDYAQ